MAAKRPARPPHQAKRAEAEPAPPADRLSISVTVGDELYVLHLDEVTSAMEIELHRDSTLTIEEVLGSEDWPRYQLAAVVWLVRRIAGESVTYSEVADAMPWMDNGVVIGDLSEVPSPLA